MATGDVNAAAAGRSEPAGLELPASQLELPAARLELRSFDGGVRERCVVVRPDRYRDLERLPDATPRIVRGGGFSYAAASFGAGAVVQDFRRFDRVLAFDAALGRLRCEAGATLGKVFATAIGDGWYLPTQPGHPDLTIGGCLAADAHGKNPSQEGTFRRQVLGLTLFHPRIGSVAVGPEEGSALFELTCGGYGLTGHVVDVTLQLRRAPAACEVRRLPAADLAHTVELLEEWEGRAALLYSWNDLTAGGAAFGRGFVSVGTAVDGAGAADGAARAAAGAVASGRYDRLPAHASTAVPFWNRWSTGVFNRVYRRAMGLGGPRRLPLFDVLFPIASKAAYFKLFGRGGLLEYQVLVPRAAFADFARELGRGLRRFGVAPTLGSCKLFAGEGGGLRFDGRGVALAIDLPRRQAAPGLLELLDGLTVDAGAIPNAIKDSRLPAAVVARCYPGYEELRRRLRAHDSDRIYRSELSQRLEL